MESKNYHFNVSNPELISKIERFNEYGFANRTDFFLEAIKAYDTIDDGDKTNFEDSDEDYLSYIK